MRTREELEKDINLATEDLQTDILLDIREILQIVHADKLSRARARGSLLEQEFRARRMVDD